jgi:hypothetical protein
MTFAANLPRNKCAIFTTHHKDDGHEYSKSNNHNADWITRGHFKYGAAPQIRLPLSHLSFCGGPSSSGNSATLGVCTPQKTVNQFARSDQPNKQNGDSHHIKSFLIVARSA